jgi:hypothetical protein
MGESRKSLHREDEMANNSLDVNPWLIWLGCSCKVGRAPTFRGALRLITPLIGASLAQAKEPVWQGEVPMDSPNFNKCCL